MQIDFICNLYKLKSLKMDLRQNADRFTGNRYVKTYDKFRPYPPEDILFQTLNYLNKQKADVVVDLGCGTGISTAIWQDLANKIFGVEPSQEMIDVALNRNDDEKIEYQLGYSNNVALPSSSVDIISCSQSFHWMEPVSTLKEIDRLLIKGGVMVIYDVIWPPSVNFLYEKLYAELFTQIERLTSQLKETVATRWDKNEHFNNVRKSGHYTFAKETYFHKTEEITTEKLLGIALSQGGLEALLKRGYSEEEIGLIAFEKQIREMEQLPFERITYNYRVIYAIK